MVNAAYCFVSKSTAHKQDHNSEGKILMQNMMQNTEWLIT